MALVVASLVLGLTVITRTAQVAEGSRIADASRLAAEVQENCDGHLLLTRLAPVEAESDGLFAAVHTLDELTIQVDASQTLSSEWEVDNVEHHLHSVLASVTDVAERDVWASGLAIHNIRADGWEETSVVGAVNPLHIQLEILALALIIMVWELVHDVVQDATVLVSTVSGHSGVHPTNWSPCSREHDEVATYDCSEGEIFNSKGVTSVTEAEWPVW